MRPRKVQEHEHNFDQVANLRNFKRKDVSSRNYKLKKDADELSSPTRKGGASSKRYSKADNDSPNTHHSHHRHRGHHVR
jgi:hypothetical protein